MSYNSGGTEEEDEMKKKRKKKKKKKERRRRRRRRRKEIKLTRNKNVMELVKTETGGEVNRTQRCQTCSNFN